MNEQTLDRHCQEARQVLSDLTSLREPVTRAASAIATALSRGGKLLTAGNGGSAAEAMHLATEFICRFQNDRRPYPAICLNSSGGDLTAISNDYGFDDIFARPVRALAGDNDVLVAFSTSGNSPNVVSALRAAEEVGCARLAMLGAEPGQCEGLASIELCVPSTVTARVQEGHQVLLHVLCEMVEDRLER